MTATIIKWFDFKSKNYRNEPVKVIVRQLENDLVVINKRSFFTKEDCDSCTLRFKVLRKFKEFYYIEFEEYFRRDTLVVIANNLI